jgi:putative acetyltransferase
MTPFHFTIRQAAPREAEAIARVHVESIRTVGAKYYQKNIIDVWAAPRGGDRYVLAMERGELFFLAVCREPNTEPWIGGFSSYRVEEGKHRIAVYVHEKASRKGVGTALFQAAEKDALQRGASEIHVDASLVAVDFYRANGFEKWGHGQHLLFTGIAMDCVFMRKLTVKM